MRCVRCGHSNPFGFRFCGECGTSLGNACTACGAVNPPDVRFCGQCGAAFEGGDKPSADIEGPVAERRRVTVLFCDLVGSTRLSQLLDPERLRDVLIAYRETCGEVVRRHDGYIARYVGDGILICFGYPSAVENSAERAVRVALEIVAAMGQLSNRLRLQGCPEMSVHVGVHSGLVVIGELVAGETIEKDAVVGETPNIAAHLQQVAGPNEIVVSEATWGFVRRQFEGDLLESVQLKGSNRPVRAWRVTSERRREGGAALLDDSAALPLVGREREMAILVERWALAAEGHGQVALVMGEAGIGKSRLTRALARRLTHEPHRVLAAFCTDVDENSEFLPVIELVRREAGLERGDSTDEMRAKLGRMTALLGLDETATKQIVWPLLSLQDASASDSDMSPKRLRALTIEWMVETTLALAERAPVLFVIEDAHWADPSTLEFLAALVGQTIGTPILLVVTSRPGLSPAWASRSNVFHVDLPRLVRRDAISMIDVIAGGRPLPANIVSELVAKTEGVPLFLEEMTRAALAGDSDTTGAFPSASGEELAIPDTLHGSLMARLDRLDGVKSLAQIAAAVGAECPHALLRAIWPGSESDMARHVRSLIEAEIMIQRGFGNRAIYTFRHVLIREAAYDSLLLATRRKYHLRIAEAMRTACPDLVGERPEIFAHHCYAGGLVEDAINAWAEAARRALARSANVEALGHLDKAIAALSEVQDARRAVELELDLLIAKGSAHIALEGYAASPVERCYGRAREICSQLDFAAKLSPVLRGLQSFYQVRGPMETARELAQQLLQLAEAENGPPILVQAHRRLGWCMFCLGEFDGAREHLERAITLYDRDQTAEHLARYGADPAVIGLINVAWLDWYAGRTEQAIARRDRAIKLGREIAHPLSLAYALCMGAAVAQAIGDVETVLADATETLAVAEDRGFSYWIAWATALKGWAIAAQGRREDGLLLLEDGLMQYHATGSELFVPHCRMLMADILARAGRWSETKDALDQAEAAAQRIQVRFILTELLWRRAEVLANCDEVDTALEWLEQAIALARKQGAAGIERLATAELDRLKRRMAS